MATSTIKRLRAADVGAVSTSTVVDVAHGGTGATTLRGLQTVALYNTDGNGITAYPTAAGLYRLTGTLPAGMPTGANAYGVLLICGAGGYYMHIYADAVGSVYIAEKNGTGAPETWRKVTTTNVAPVT